MITPYKEPVNSYENLSFDEIFQAANGYWPAILNAAGVNVPGNKKGSPCPVCGGKDRFSFLDTNGDGTYFCRGGADGHEHSGNGITLLKECTFWSSRQAFQFVAEYRLLIPTACNVNPARKPNKVYSQAKIHAVVAPLSEKQKRNMKHARRLWDNANDNDEAVGSHPYAIAKGIGWAAGARRGIASSKLDGGIGQNSDCIIVPARSISDGKIQAVQCINSKGVKQTFGPVSGCGLILGDLETSNEVYVVEGWADCVSVAFHEFNGQACSIAAFGSGSMPKVARLVAEKYPAKKVFILRDAP